MSYEICTLLVLCGTYYGRKKLILPISFRVTLLTLGNHLDAHELVKWHWRIWVNTWQQYTEKDNITTTKQILTIHDDVIKWKHFPCYWPFVPGIPRSPVNSPHKSQWCGALMFSLIYAWINSWVNNREAGDFRRHHAHYDVILMPYAYLVGYTAGYSDEVVYLDWLLFVVPGDK